MSEEAAPAAAGGELQQIQSLMGDRESAYWRGPQAEALQQRYRTLIETGVGNVPAPAAKGSEAEIARLEAQMKTDINAWHRDDRARARLLELYEQRENGGTADYEGGPADDAERHEVLVHDIPALSSGLQVAPFEEIIEAPWANTLAAQWGTDFPKQIAAAQAGAVELLSTMPADQQAEVIASFDALPVRTQAQILKRLAGGR